MLYSGSWALPPTLSLPPACVWELQGSIAAFLAFFFFVSIVFATLSDGELGS